jgi:ketol-acid reductoisomerase
MYEKHIVIFGYGQQGSAQSANLKDSGKNVSVFLRPESPHFSLAKKNGIPLITDACKAASCADIAVILIPDTEQPRFWKEIENSLPGGSTVIFAHGFNIHYRQIIPRADLDVVLVAPLSHAKALRDDFLSSRGVPCLIAVAQDATGNAKKTALDYAGGISRGGPFIETSVAEEVETDLFAEQAVLCGGLFELIRAGFDTLVKKGYNPDIAYFCCLKEVRALANLVFDHGISGTREKISGTALFGDLTRGPRIIDKHVRSEMNKILDEIRRGRFTEELLHDSRQGNHLLLKLFEKDKRHPIEEMHRKHNKTEK